MPTLKDYRDRPATSTYDIRHADLHPMLGRMREHVETLTCTKPVQEATAFYLLSHYAGILFLKHGETGALSEAECDVMERYYETLNSLAMRMFIYLWAASFRETRHGYCTAEGVTYDDPQAGVWIKAIAKSLAPHGGAVAMQEALKMEAVTGATVGGVLQGAQELFYKGSWSSAYGGTAWGSIADCISRFVSGQTSAEVMIDTAFALSHNTGNVFNKGLLFNPAPRVELLQVLDVQRAGMIPELLKSAGVDSHTQIVDRLSAAVGVSHGDKVDWDKVSESGVGTWTHDGGLLSAHGPSGMSTTTKTQTKEGKGSNGDFMYAAKLNTPKVERDKL